MIGTNLSKAFIYQDSLVTILQSDDEKALKAKKREYPKDFENLILRIPYKDKPSVPVGLAGAAIHFRSENCLKNIPFDYQTIKSIEGGPTAIEIAFDESWDKGIDYILESNYQIDKMDSNFKTPIVNLLNKGNLTVFKKVLDDSIKKGRKMILKHVKYTKEKSLTAIIYCVLEHNIKMINACQYAYENQLLDDDDINEAIDLWKKKYPYEDLPYFFKNFSNIDKIVQAKDYFTIDIKLSDFAPIPMENSYLIDDVFSETQDLVVYFESLKLDKNNIIQSGVDMKNILIDLPEYVIKNGIDTILTEYYLVQYFNQLINDYCIIDSKWVFPKISTDNKIWNLFGVILANLAYTGSFYFPKNRFIPLIYAVLLNDQKKKIYNPDYKYIADFFQFSRDIYSTKIEPSVKDIQKADENKISDVLMRKWKEMIGNVEIYKEIKKGFYSFSEEIIMNKFTKLSIRSIVFWFDGFMFEPDLFIKLLDTINFHVRDNLNSEYETNYIYKCKQLYLQWFRENPKKGMRFITKIGSSRFLNPLFKIKSIYLFYPETRNEDLFPKYICDTQDIILPLISNINQVNELYQNVKNSDISFIKMKDFMSSTDAFIIKKIN